MTSDTVTSASHIKSGLVGHLADGTTATGTLVEKDVKSVTYNLSGGATASISTTEVVTDQGFCVKLSVQDGYALNKVSVTMDGVDITSQVFTPDEAGEGVNLGTKTITQNGTYSASSDNLDGFSSVTVNCSGGTPSLQTKTVSYTPTTSSQSAQVTADSGYDGLEQVNVSVGAIPSEYIIPSGSQTITQNNTYDVASLAEVIVSVAGSGGAVSGTITPSSNLRSLTLSDCIGKNNLIVFPASDVSSMPVNRTHYGDMFYNGKCIIRGSANSSGSAWTLQTTLNPASTSGLGDTWDNTTGVLTITAGVTANHGGYFAAGITYAYCAW